MPNIHHWLKFASLNLPSLTQQVLRTPAGTKGASGVRIHMEDAEMWIEQLQRSGIEVTAESPAQAGMFQTMVR